MDSIAKPSKPQIRQILTQYPQRRNGNERTHKQAQRRRESRGQQMPGVTFEAPIHDLEPLRTLNAYRRDLGLGPSRNLISSAIYSYDPTAVAECYERSMSGGFFYFPLVYPSNRRENYDYSSAFLMMPFDSSTGTYWGNLSPQTQHNISDDNDSGARSPTPQQSGDNDDSDSSPSRTTSADSCIMS